MNTELEIIGYQPLIGFDIPFRAVLNRPKDSYGRHWVLIGVQGGRLVKAVPHFIEIDRLVTEEQALELESNVVTRRSPKQVMALMKRAVANHNNNDGGGDGDNKDVIDFGTKHPPLS